jgi:YD repeat-containing protein
MATGDTYIKEADVRIPGLGGGLTLIRTWNSVWPANEGGARVGIFGLGWTSSFEESIYVGSDGYMKYARADGGFWSFGFVSQNSNNTVTFGVAGPANQTATLTQTTGNWTLAFKNGEQRVFDGTSGKLLSITDRNGNTTQLTYDASYRLATVTDPASRHLYFSYAIPASYLASSAETVGRFRFRKPAQCVI